MIFRASVVPAGMALSALLAFPLLLGGCVSSVPHVNAEADVALAAGLPEPIRFSTVGGPLDVPPEEGTEGEPATLGRTEAARRALNHSPEVQTALAEVRAALAEARQSRVLANPVLDVNIRFPEGGGDEVIEAGLSQSLIDLLRRPARSRAADARLRAAAARAVGEALDVLRHVESTYADAQAVEAHLHLLAEQRSLLEQLLEMAQARRQAGEAGRLEVLGVQTRQAALQAEMLSRRADQQALRLTLARLIGRPSGPLQWRLDRMTAPQSTNTAESQWIALALEHRPEVQAAIFELAALGQEVRLASLEPFDDLGVGAALESEEDLSAGPAASVPIPIFDWGRHRRARAEAQVIAARHHLTAARRQIVEDVRQALSAAEAAAQAAQILESQLLPLKREQVDQTRAAYRAGFADTTDVLQAEQELLDAQAQLIDARLRRQAAAADLKHAAGGAAAVPSGPTTQPTTTRNSR